MEAVLRLFHLWRSSECSWTRLETRPRSPRRPVCWKPPHCIQTSSHWQGCKWARFPCWVRLFRGDHLPRTLTSLWPNACRGALQHSALIVVRRQSTIRLTTRANHCELAGGCAMKARPILRQLLAVELLWLQLQDGMARGSTPALVELIPSRRVLHHHLPYLCQQQVRVTGGLANGFGRRSHP